MLPAATRLWLFEKRLWLSEKRLRGFARRLPLKQASSSGLQRGGAIDRFFIDAFLSEHSSDIRGRVLECDESRYTTRFGGDRVTKVDVLDVEASNADATFVANFIRTKGLDSELYDCIICTQALQKTLDVRSAIRQLQCMLRPGGVLLVTSHGISKLSRHPRASWDEYWRLTSRCLETLLGEVFLPRTLR